MEQAILYDSSKCTACKACQVACKCWNELPSPLEKNSGEFKGTLQNPPDLNGTTRVIITFNEEDNGQKYGVNWAFGRRSCQHCTDPACVQICPSGALFVDDDTKLVSYDQDKCIGCQYCSTACPYDVPRYDNNKINKCTGCLDRVRNGRAPACVTTCAPGALQFGDRDEMVAEAESRVAALHEKGFDDACVYGVDELGGLHVIQVLKYGIAAHGQVENPTVNPMVGLTHVWRPLAGAAAAATVIGLGVSFLRGVGYRRDTLHYDETTGETIDLDTQKVVAEKDVVNEGVDSQGKGDN